MHLLIMSCSSKKITTTEKIPAFDLYSGVFFAVLKKTFKDYPSIKEELKIVIISAKYGLISSDTLISYYDLKMNRIIAASQRERNTDLLEEIIKKDHPESITVALGKTYLESIDFSNVEIPIKYITGGIGVMMHHLKEWLINMQRSDRSDS